MEIKVINLLRAGFKITPENQSKKLKSLTDPTHNVVAESDSSREEGPAIPLLHTLGVYQSITVGLLHQQPRQLIHHPALSHRLHSGRISLDMKDFQNTCPLIKVKHC